MSTSSASPLESVIRESGEGWILDCFAAKQDAITHIAQTLDAVNRLGSTRFGGNAPDLTEQAIVGEFRRNPRRVRAFIQALGGTRTPEILLMAWRVTQGMEIQRMRVGYERLSEFHMRVVLRSPYDDVEEVYESSSINDFAVLRHIGVLEVGGKPAFEGFYALK